MKQNKYYVASIYSLMIICGTQKNFKKNRHTRMQRSFPFSIVGKKYATVTEHKNKTNIIILIHPTQSISSFKQREIRVITLFCQDAHSAAVMTLLLSSIHCFIFGKRKFMIFVSQTTVLVVMTYENNSMFIQIF